MKASRHSRAVALAKRKRAPDPENFTAKEWNIIQGCRTPRQVQQFLRALPYNWERKGRTLRTFRGVVRHGTASCIEAALSAATILEQHGHPPLLLDMESVDDLDHVVLLFGQHGRYGSVAKSRDAGLHGRKPVFRTVRQLVMSYVDPYVDGSGRITGYGVAHLDSLVRVDWRLSERNVWAVENALIAMPHKKLDTSDRRYERVLQRYLEFRKKCPRRPAIFYANRDQWM